MDQYCILKNAIVLEISGADSKRYLNSRLSNNILALQNNQSLMAAALDPKAKTEGFFLVYKKNEDEYFLICDGGNPTEVIGAFSRYKVADRVEIKDLSQDYSLVKVLNSNYKPSCKNSDLVIEKSNYFEILTLNIDEFLNSNTNLTKVKYTEWKLFCAKNKIYTFPEELNPNLFFPEAQLENAVAKNAGCYVGQEAVEMVTSRGKLPAKICVIKFLGSSSIKSGEPIFSEDKEVGKVISIAYDKQENVTYCFARIKDFSANKFLVDNQKGILI